MSAPKPSFSGDVQFARYTDSSRGGPCTIWRHADRSDLEAFIGKEGKRYMAVFVEIGDDELPVTSKAQESDVARARMAPLCEWAVYRCADPQFYEWFAWAAVRGQFPATWADEGAPEEWCKSAILAICGVTSRKELDTDPEAGEKLKRFVMRPYADWLASRMRKAA